MHDRFNQLAYQKYENANRHILEYIVRSGVVNPAVLDVGCWMGAFGEHLKRYKECQVDGIEINREVSEVALKRGYRHIYPIDLNNSDFSEIDQKYDFIVCGDVLEHMIDPGSVITHLKSKLAETGFFAVSLPNVGFVLYRLLHLIGCWEYKEYGVMDKTHLRFFTLNSMKRFFNLHNLRIMRMDSNMGLNRSAFVVRIATAAANICPSLLAVQIVFLLKAGE